MPFSFDPVSVTVEIGFNSEPLDEPQSFTDVSDYVRNFDISRGRQLELSSFNAAVATVVLDNSDDRFTPQNTSGPYYGKIKPSKRLRIGVSYSGTTYYIFEGFLENLPQVFGLSGSESLVEFTAIDFFSLMNKATLLSNSWQIGVQGFSNAGQTTNTAFEQQQELSHLRIGRILDSMGFPSGKRNLQTGQFEVQTQATNSNVLSAIRAVEFAEQGEAFLGRGSDGFDFIFRNAAYRQTVSSQATFGNDTGQLPFNDVSLTFDQARLVNQSSITRNGGSEQTWADAGSKADFGSYTESHSGTLNITDTEALNIAKRRVASFSQSDVRVTSMICSPQADTNLWVQVLGRELGDEITINLPTPAGNSYSSDVNIEGIEHSVDAINNTWTWTVRTSPVQIDAWVLGTGALGSTTNLGF